MSDAPIATRARYLPWRPAAALRPHVATMLGYDIQLAAPGSHLGLPSTRLTLVLPLADPLDVGWWGYAGTRVTQWACLSGLHTTPAEISHRHRLAGVQLDLTPRAARALLGVPAGELSGVLTELGGVAPVLADLPERLASAPSWRDRLALVEARLLDALARTPDAAARPEIGWALRRLAEGSTVTGVADEVGLSRRHLGELFRTEYGVTPKQFQRVARLEAARHALLRRVRGGRQSLARIAAEHGFADQAHLTREWTSLAGCTPTEWLRTEFPFLQDTDAELSVS